MGFFDAAGKVLLDLLRSAAFFIDNIVYSFIPILYKLFDALAHVDLFRNNPTVDSMMDRIYILAGVFMLFKLSFSMITYIADPSAFSDKNKGFTNLIKRIVIALLLLVLIPFLFDKLYEYQGIILDSNAIPNLVLGNTDMSKPDLESRAKDMQFLIFSPFFQINGELTKTDGKLEACSPSKYDYAPLANVIGTADMANAGVKDARDLSETCLNIFTDELGNFSDDASARTTIKRLFKQVDIDERDFVHFGDLVTWQIDGVYVINYYAIISTLCGGYLVFLLLSFCFDIAARAIKLLFLQVLSPVAVISSLDPTSSSQDDKLKEWGMECLKTFLSLFLRLLVVYIVVQLASIITTKMFSVDSYGSAYGVYYNNYNAGELNIWVYIFLVLGSFQVAKKIPELIEKAVGIKMSGELNMNPFKNPFVGAATALVPGLAVSGAANLIGMGRRMGNLWSKVADAVDDRIGADAELREAEDNLRARRHETNMAARDLGIERAKGRHMNVTSYEEALARAKDAEAEAQQQVDSRRAAAENATANLGHDIRHGLTQSVSAVAGVFTGAASGAIRSAAGAYNKGPMEAMRAVERARAKVTDVRNDRDVRADSLSIPERVSETYSRFANIKDAKTYGVGQLDAEIKKLRNELKNVESQMIAVNADVHDARKGTVGVSNSQLKTLLDNLDKAIDAERRVPIAKEIERVISALPDGHADRIAAENFIKAYEVADGLTAKMVAINKEISSRQDAINAGHRGGAEKK